MTPPLGATANDDCRAFDDRRDRIDLTYVLHVVRPVTSLRWRAEPPLERARLHSESSWSWSTRLTPSTSASTRPAWSTRTPDRVIMMPTSPGAAGLSEDVDD
jgi:hypothetical protein